MKAVLVGTDLMYRQDGKIVPIEINTNVGIDSNNRIESGQETWSHLDNLVSFVQEHDIDCVYLEGFTLRSIEDKIIVALGPSVNVAEMESNGTADAVEDTDNVLICRSSYSDEALVDAFCRDKILFLRATQFEDFATEYLLKTGGTLEGDISYFPDNGNYPNFIVKYRYPYYDDTVYPKLLKFSTKQELEEWAEANLEEDYFISPFYYNENELISVKQDHSDKRMKLYRNWSLFVQTGEEEITSVDLGTYTKVCGEIKDDEVEYVGHELADHCRSMFMTKGATPNYFADVLVEATDLVLMADGTWKEAASLEFGDIVQSLNVPTSGAVDIRAHVADYNVPFSELQESSSFATASVQSMPSVSAFIDKISVTFTDGTDWFDSANSAYLVIDSKDGTVEFQTIDQLSEGREVILLDTRNTNNPVYEIKTIASIERTREFVEGYQLQLNGPYIFVTKALGEESAYASIEHNGSDTFSWMVYFMNNTCSGNNLTGTTGLINGTWQGMPASVTLTAKGSCVAMSSTTVIVRARVKFPKKNPTVGDSITMEDMGSQQEVQMQKGYMQMTVTKTW